MWRQDVSLQCGVKVQSRFHPGDLVTRTGEREIRSVSGRVGMYERVAL